MAPSHPLSVPAAIYNSALFGCEVDHCSQITTICHFDNDQLQWLSLAVVGLQLLESSCCSEKQLLERRKCFPIPRTARGVSQKLALLLYRGVIMFDGCIPRLLCQDDGIPRLASRIEWGCRKAGLPTWILVVLYFTSPFLWQRHIGLILVTPYNHLSEKD